MKSEKDIQPAPQMDEVRLPLKEQVALLPLSPGVYQFVDQSGAIIYVGKAKSLRKRVSSYFVESRDHSAKVRVMVKRIVERDRCPAAGELADQDPAAAV